MAKSLVEMTGASPASSRIRLREFMGIAVGVSLAWRIADSRGLFLIMAVGGALLIDRHTNRRFRWDRRNDMETDLQAARSPARVLRIIWLMAPWIIGGMNLVILAAFDYGPLHWREIAYIMYVSACGITLIQWMIQLATGNRTGWRRAAWRVTPVVATILLGAFFGPIIAFMHPPRRMASTTPAEQGLTYDTVVFHTADGLQLGGWFIPADNARGTVIYCHGVTSNRGQVRDLLPSLHEMGLNVLAFDFRGHGESDGHTLCFGSREVNDLVAAHAFVRSRAPALPIMLLGGSYGAAMTITSLDRLPDVACAWVDASFARFSTLAQHHFRDRSTLIRNLKIRMCSIAAWLDAGVWLSDMNPIDHLARSQVPMMFLHGRRDERIPFSEGEALYAACTAPKERFWVDRATHYDLLTVSYDEYLRRLRGFVDTHMPRKNSGPIALTK